MINSEQGLAHYVGRDAGQPWPSYTWPGAYPIAYVMRDGGLLCSDCMTAEAVTFGHDPYRDDQWNVVHAFAFGASTDYPETDQLCDHCYAVICTGEDNAATQ